MSPSNASTAETAPGSTVTRTGARTIVTWIVTAQAVLLVVVLWYLWVQVFYFGDVDGLAILSTHRGDRPPVPVVPWQLGVHTFGDFIFPYAQALVPNPWVDYPVPHANSYPPLLMLVFKLSTFLPYTLALGLFLLLNVASMAIPVVVAARRLPLPQLLVALCLLVLVSFPFLMVVDRGNAQGLLILPLYVFAVAWREGRWRRAAIALSVAAALKLYPVLLVMALLVERRFRDAALALGAAAVVTIVLFDLYPGGLSATMQGFIAALLPFSTPTPDRITVSNYSALGMVANFCAAAFGPASAPVTWLLGHSSFFGILYLIGVAAVVYARKLPFIVRLACALSVLTLVNSLSYGYTLSFVVVVVAELLRDASIDDRAGDLPRPLAVALAAAVTTTLVLWPFRLPVTGISVGAVLVPASWFALTATALYYGYAPAVHGA
ncbi:MAG: glycosyltransferase 87 family protein [Candidatus Eremiobacteraeota bacterium]|nr:glycosyltransferase 87 family protein [Candidatus Eremiobacteraeota bacterium]